MSERIVKIRHILYRLKAKMLYSSSFGEIVRSIMWKELRAGQGIRVLFKQSHNVFKDYSLKQITNPAVIERFTWENETWSYQDDAIYEIKEEVIVEPKLSLAYIEPNIFITQSKSKAHQHVSPDFKYRVFGPQKKNFTYIPEVIHFDGYASKNLYHFIDDALNPLLLVLQSGLVPREVPIIIHEDIYKIPYVQYFLKMPALAGCQWIVQKKDEWIRTDKMYKGTTSQVSWKKLYNELSGTAVKNPHRRVFLNRKSHFQRTIKNIAEIQAVLDAYGFETVYAEDLTYEQQVQLFSEVKYLVAIHGAGITNLLHADISKVHLLELFSSSLLHPHFYWVFNQLGLHHYDAVLGSAFDINWNYTIEKAEFEASMKKMFPEKG